MTRDPILRRRQLKVAVGVVAVSLVVCALLTLALIYLAQGHPRS